MAMRVPAKVIGTTVYNEQNQKLGSVDEVLIGRNGVFAVISTDKQKVAVPFQVFVFGDSSKDGHDKMVLPNATQAQLNSMPPFYYDATSYANNNNSNNNLNNNPAVTGTGNTTRKSNTNG
jgi:hypothetical protein